MRRWLDFRLRISFYESLISLHDFSMHFPRFSSPFRFSLFNCRRHSRFMSNSVSISSNFTFHCLGMSDEVQSEPERDLIRRFDVISAGTFRSMTPRRQLKGSEAFIDADKRRERCRCMPRIVWKSRTRKFADDVDEVLRKTKDSSSVLDPLHHDFLSRFKSFCYFSVSGKI